MTLPTDATSLQELLDRAGFSPGPIDGIVGPKTLAALERWANSLPRTSEPEVEVDRTDEFDERTEKNLKTLIPEAEIAFRHFLSWAIPYVHYQYKLTLKGISGSRTAEEQNKLYAQGRTEPGPKVTNAKAGQSNHNYGLALDLGLFSEDGKIYIDSAHPSKADEVYEDISTKAKDYGLYWGGYWTYFKDYPHFQYGNLTVAQMQDNYPIYT